mgnify:CR=1 FL=1
MTISKELSRANVLEQVLAERERQDSKWGEHITLIHTGL